MGFIIGVAVGAVLTFLLLYSEVKLRQQALEICLDLLKIRELENKMKEALHESQEE